MLKIMKKFPFQLPCKHGTKIRFKEITIRKGMTMGEVIEDMMPVYDSHQ